MSRILTLSRRWKAIVLAGGFAFVALVVLAVWEWPTYQARRDVRRALATGRFQDAWKIVEHWVRQRPHSGEAQYFRAKTAIALGRKRDMVLGLKEARALGYRDDRLAVVQALIDAQYGRMKQARPVLARAFADAQEPDLMLNEALARVYLETYDFAHAGPVLKRWAQEAPTDPRPLLWHAALLRRRDAEAQPIIDDYRQVLQRAPKNAEAHLGLAEQLEQTHQNAQAAAIYSAYIALRPDDPAGHIGAGRNAAELREDSTARAHFDQALELDPGNAAAHLERAKLNLRLGDFEKALVDLDQAVAATPFDSVVHYQRSLVLKRLGRHSEAVLAQQTFDRLRKERLQLEELQERLGEAPDDLRLQYQIAHWMFKHGYDDEAVKWSQKILLDSPGHRGICLLLIDYYTMHGQPDRAEQFRKQIAMVR